MNRITLSVIIPNYNDSSLLKGLISQILIQTRLPDEIIFIDDCSTDNSVEIINDIIKNNRSLNILLARNDTNSGVIYSSMLGAKISRSTYIYFASTDDSIAPIFFEKTLGVLSQHLEAGLCSSIVTSIYPNNISIKLNSPKKCLTEQSYYLNPNECLFLLKKQGSWMGGNSCIYKRKAFFEMGGLNDKLGPYCDIYIAIQIAAKYGVCFIDKSMSYFKISPNSYSSRITLDDSLRAYSYMAKLMLTQHPNLFSEDFAMSFKREGELSAKIINLYNLLKQSRKIINSVIIKKNYFDLVFILILKCINELLFFSIFLILTINNDSRHVLIKYFKVKKKYFICWVKNMPIMIRFFRK